MMNDEYIKREDAIDIVKNLKRFSCFGDDGFVQIPMVYCELMKVASADVAPVRHGRWDLDMSGAWCSVCGEYSEGEYIYCPNCGARMDGESND